MSMQSTIENTSELGRKITITIPKENVVKQIQSKISEYSKTIRMPGFRPGKVPKKVIEQKHFKQVRGEVVSKFFEDSFKEILEKEKFRPAGEPVIDNVINEEDKDVEYTINIEIYPEIELQDFSKITLSKPKVTISDKDIQTEIDRLQKQFATFEEVSRAAKKGDKVSINFEGTIDGKLFDGGKAEKVQVKIGGNQFIPGFEDGLIGCKKDEDKILKIKFPDDYHVKELASKDVEFAIKVLGVSEPKKSKLDESFASSIGVREIDEKILESQIKDQIKDNLNVQLTNVIEENLRDQVVQQLTESNNFSVPQILVDEEKRYIQAENDLDDPMSEKEIEEEAQKRVKSALIIGKIISDNDLKPDANKVREQLFKMSYSTLPEDFLKKYPKESRQLIERINHNVVTEQAVDVAVKASTFIEKEASLKDVIEGNFFESDSKGE